MAEGAEMLTLMAPVRIEANENDEAVALWVQPQIPGESDKTGRPRPEKADLPEVRVEADVIVVAIGQGIEIAGFEQSGVPIKRGTFVAASSSQVGNMNDVFAGGDCVTGPASAIRAIAAGKVAAANIDEHLGFHHDITVEVDIPAPRLNNSPPHGRINTTEREAAERKNDFEDIECGLTWEGACTGGVPLPALRPLRIRDIQRRSEQQMVTLTIDKQTISVPEGTTILEAARSAGISIPTLCYLKGINEIAACRICVVEVEGHARLVPACDNAVVEGMVVHTNSPRVREARRDQPAADPQPAREQLHQVYPQRQLQAADPVPTTMNLLGDHHIKDLKNIPAPDFSNPVVRACEQPLHPAACAAFRCATRSRA